MNIYNDLLNTFINLFYGSLDNLENLKVTTPLVTNNIFQDFINAIQLNLATISTIATIILIVLIVVNLPIQFYKMFKINDFSQGRKRRRRK